MCCLFNLNFHCLHPRPLWPVASVSGHLRLLVYFRCLCATVHTMLLCQEDPSRQPLSVKTLLILQSLKGYLFLKFCLIPLIEMNPSLLWASTVLPLYFSCDTYTTPWIRVPEVYFHHPPGKQEACLSYLCALVHSPYPQDLELLDPEQRNSHDNDICGQEGGVLYVFLNRGCQTQPYTHHEHSINNC